MRIFTEPQQGASYDQLLAVAKTAEECGYGAFFRSDHVLKMGSVSGLPGVTDAWITLAGLARDTSTIRLGTLVTPVTFRDPGMFAVAVSQVDQMSGGRVEVGLGAGWYDAEHDAFGVPFPAVRDRYDRLEDQLAILHGIWSAPAGGNVRAQGHHPRGVDHRRHAAPGASTRARRSSWAGEPALGRLGSPSTTPMSTTPLSFPSRRCARCMSASGTPARRRDAIRRRSSTRVAQVLCCGEDEAEIARRAQAIGREVGELRENGLTGTPAEVLEKIGTFVDAGAERLYLQVLDLTDLDHLRLVAEQVLPHAPASA